MEEIASSKLSYLSGENFFIQLQEVAASIIWKNESRAKSFEHLCDPREVDYFMAANKGMIAFESVFSIPEYIFRTLGFPEDEVKRYSSNKDLIPEGLIPTVMKVYWNDIISRYEERNTYYRMLNGLPPIDTDPSEYVYNTEYLDIPMDVPLHQLPLPDKYTLEARGYIDKMLKLYPDKEYLNYMAKNNVEVFKARSAESFAILSIKTSEPESLTEDFKMVYKACRDYMVRVHYTPAFKSMDRDDYYENFIALAILFMSITQMNHKYLETDITRDFYDLESLKAVYDSYGVPFYEKVPLKYHKRIVKWINRIIANKGNTQVFFDLSALFDYSSMQIYYYYLTKEHKVNGQGNPIFCYKEDGTPDYESMFEVSFSKVPVGEDPYIHIIDKETHVPYESITEEDEFWINDDELLDELFKDEFNFIESKYVGISLQFDIMKIIYEECYFLRMLQDRKWDTEELYIYYGDIKVSLFDLVMYLIASICRKWDFPGVIPNKPEQVGKVLGFNFKDSLNKVREEVINNPLLDDEINDFIVNMNIESLTDVHRLYGEIMDLKKFLERKLISVHDRETYQAYKVLYQTLLTTELIPQVFATEEDEETGEYTLASSFKDLLYHRNSYLYSKLIDPDVEVEKEIDNVLMTLKSLSDRLEYLEMAEGIDIEMLVTHLYNLLEFARSAKTELLEFEIIYLLNARATNMIKIFMELREMHAQIWVEDTGMRFEDVIAKSELSYYDEDSIILRELMIHLMKAISKDEKLDINVIQKEIYAVVNVFEALNFDDTIENTLYELSVSDRMGFIERFICQSNLSDISDIMDLTHEVLTFNSQVDEKDIIPLEDVLIPSILEIEWRTNILLREELIPASVLFKYHEGVDMIEKMVSDVNYQTHEMINLVDSGEFVLSYNLNELYQFIEKTTSDMTVCFKTYIKPYIRCMKKAEYYYNEIMPFCEKVVEADFGELAPDQV